MSDYPEVWDFEKDAVLQGALVEVRSIEGTKFGTDEPETRFVIEVETGDGERHTVWLNGAVLKRSFTEEARNRKAIGERFRDREAITIEYLGKVKGAKFTYKNFNVEFEYAAPSLDGFDALAGSDYQQSEGDELVAAAVTTNEAPAAVPAEAPSDDDIPF